MSAKDHKPAMQLTQSKTFGAAPRSFKKTRRALLLTLAGFLILLAAVGAYSFMSLRDLSKAEDAAFQRFLSRNQSVAKITRSVRIYNSDVDNFLTSDQPSPGSAASQLAGDVSGVRLALANYPSNRQPDESRLLAQIERDLSDEVNAVAPTLSWTTADLRKRTPEFERMNVIPRQLALMQVSEELVAFNNREMSDEDHALLASFRNARINLIWAVVATFGLALLLSLASGLYMHRAQLREQLRYDELEEHRRKLQELSGRLVDAQEQERRAISRELHDEVGQSLEALLMETSQLSKLAASEDTALHDQIARLKSVAKSAVDAVRNIALLLRPSMLDDLGLTSALEWQAREISRRGNMEVEVHSENVSDQLDDARKVCIYRLAQEALSNAARHALAKNATVRVAQTGDRISIEVSDNGKSFDAQHVRGMGLLGMEERVKRLGGTLTVESHPGVGTSVKAVLPLGSSDLSQIA